MAAKLPNNVIAVRCACGMLGYTQPAAPIEPGKAVWVSCGKCASWTRYDEARGAFVAVPDSAAPAPLQEYQLLAHRAAWRTIVSAARRAGLCLRG